MAEAGPRTGRRGRVGLLLFALAGGLAAAAAAVLVQDPAVVVATLVGDDAGYYFGIARNRVLGHGWTFDRLHATTGFNPLFALLLATAYRVVLGSDPSVIGAWRVGLALSWMVMLASALVWARVWWRALPSGAPRRLLVGAALVFYTGFVALKSQYGLDGFLVLAIGGWLALDLLRRGADDHAADAVLLQGALLGLVTLARLDSLVLVAAVLGGLALLGWPRRDALRGVLARGGVAALVAGPWLAATEHASGSWMPISARLKSGFPEVDLGRGLDLVLHSSLSPLDQVAIAVAGALASVVLAVAVCRMLRGERRRLAADPLATLLLLFAAYLVGRLGFLLLFSRYDVQGGYVILAHPFNVLALLALAGRRLPDLARPAAAALVLAGLIPTAARADAARREIARQQEPGFSSQIGLARWIRAHTSPDAVLYGGGFGLAGFFADRAWINADGVVNTAAYQGVLAEGDLVAYLADRGVAYVVQFRDPDTSEPGRVAVEVPGALHEVRVRLSLPEDAVVHATRFGERAPDREVLVVRFEPDRAEAVRRPW